jgi:ribonuclease P protein component
MRARCGELARSDRQAGRGRTCSGEKSRETNLPAEQIGAQAPAWVSRSHGDQGWPQGRRGAARAWAQAAECVIGTPVPSFPVERLKRQSDFRAAAAGLRASGSAFEVQARRRAVGRAVRIGFTVSKRVGNAVERNRVRRRLREIVRMSTSGGAGGLCPGHDYVLIGRRAALAATFGEMMREFGAALSRIHAPQRGGAGSARRDPLHEAGSPSRSQKLRRNRKQPQQSPPKPPEEPSE